MRGRNTIDHWAKKGAVTRGVLLDLPIASRSLRDLVPDTSHGSVSITVDQLEAARTLTGVEYSPGCAIVVRTGFVAWYRRQDRDSRTALAESLTAPGIEHTEEMARYLWDSKASGIVSDSFATEV